MIAGEKEAMDVADTQRTRQEQAAILLDILPRLKDHAVVVLGDMVADEYIYGHPARLSREAPIPILEFTERFILPGGATNLAHNLRGLGARVTVVGVIGDDSIGRDLQDILCQRGIDTAGLIVDAARPTSTKTRIIGGSPQVVHQQVARIDRVDRSPITPATEKALLDYLQQALPACDALIISDYENGVMTGDLIDAVLPLAHQHHLIVTVDSHGDLLRFKGVTAATPNQPEAEATLNRILHTNADVQAGGQALLEGMQAQGILITRGGEGMALIERDGAMQTLPVATLSEVRDATGAGDTVAAAFTLALVAGARMIDAAHLGNIAAGIVVRKMGPATTTSDEVAQAIRQWADRGDAQVGQP